MKQLVIEDLNKLPEVLRAERIRQNKSQKQISIHAHVSLNMIYLTEHGQGTPSIFILSCWARALGYDELVIKC